MTAPRPPGGGASATPQARISIDLSQLRSAPAVAREAARATEREISNAFKSLQSEMRLAQTQAQQTLTTLRTQQATVTATVRAESAERIAAARAESVAQQQAARQATSRVIEEERRKTLAMRAEIATRARAETMGGFARQAGGAALGAIGGPAALVGGALTGGALAATAGLAVVQLGRAAAEADRLATSYARQQVAAVNLAGSQSKLNSLLAAYERATGGAIDRATALSDVTRLQAVGFADSAEELERFVRAARGISVATGQQQDYVISQLQLAIANQSTLRLDQLGLGVEEVQERIAKLREENRGLTNEMAYQQAILGLAEEKFGALVDSAEAQATGAEKAAKAWRDLRLEVSKEFKPDIDNATNALAEFLDMLIRIRSENQQLRQEMIFREMGLSPGSIGLMRGGAERDAGRHRAVGAGARRAAAIAAAKPRFEEDEEAAIVDRYQGLAEIDRREGEARLDATRQYEEQRSRTISNYEQTIAREAEDFARQRARAEQQFQQDIARIHADAARREERQAQQLARSIERARADSAQRIADFEEEHAERQAELRASATERIQEIEEDYARDREQRERSHRNRLLDAASRLDAVALVQEQRRFAEENQNAEEKHRDQLEDVNKQLEKQLREEQEGHDKRLRQEARALDERIRQQQEAHDEQLREAREADTQRINDMRADFEQRKQIEDTDRAIRLTRMAQDHNQQLQEMDRQHALRIEQIGTQAQQERDKLNEEFERHLAELGIYIGRYQKEHDRLVDNAIKSFDRYVKHVKDAFALPATGGGRLGLPEQVPSYQVGGWVQKTGLAYVHQGEYVTPAPMAAQAGNGNRSLSLTLHSGAIVVQEAQRAGATAMEIEQMLVNMLDGAFPQ